MNCLIIVRFIIIVEEYNIVVTTIKHLVEFQQIDFDINCYFINHLFKKNHQLNYFSFNFG